MNKIVARKLFGYLDALDLLDMSHSGLIPVMTFRLYWWHINYLLLTMDKYNAPMLTLLKYL